LCFDLGEGSGAAVMLRRPSEPSGQGRSLSSLIEDLLGQLGHFIDQKLNLVRLELEKGPREIRCRRRRPGRSVVSAP
jgi:hypothetical protein